MRGETNTDPRTSQCDEVTPDRGRSAQPLDNHAWIVRNRESKGLAWAPRACLTCLDSSRSPRGGIGSHGANAGRSGWPLATGTGVVTTSPTQLGNITLATSC